MIIDEIYKEKFLDLLWSAIEQPDLISRIIIETNEDFQRSIIDSMVKQEAWHCAIHPSLIASTENKKIQRAKNIVDKFLNVNEDNLEGKTFLDFGCGEGHLLRLAKEKAKYAVGYDIRPNKLSTDNFNTIRNNGPYDTIVVFDVLDHAEYESQESILSNLAGLLSDNGKIFLRCHPWCSKHGTHVYQDINKAYIHYFYGEEELKRKGCKPLFTHKIITPISTYNYWISKAKLLKLSEFIVRDEVRSFFRDGHPIMVDMIKKHWKLSIDEKLASGMEFPLYQMEQQFADFVLTRDFLDS